MNILLIFLFRLRIYSYFNALIGSILVTAKDGNKEAIIVITIEKTDIDKIDSEAIGMLRNAHVKQVQLTVLADQKANMLLGIIVVALSAVSYTHLTLPTKRIV